MPLATRGQQCVELGAAHGDDAAVGELVIGDRHAFGTRVFSAGMAIDVRERVRAT
jgi:hypothetical protein